MSQLLVGLDVSLKSHHVHFMRDDGNSIKDFSVPNDQDGASMLIREILKSADKHQANQLKVGLEATVFFASKKCRELQEKIHRLRLDDYNY